MGELTTLDKLVAQPLLVLVKLGVVVMVLRLGVVFFSLYTQCSGALHFCLSDFVASSAYTFVQLIYVTQLFSLARRGSGVPLSGCGLLYCALVRLVLSPRLGCSGIFSKFCQGHIEQLCINLSTYLERHDAVDAGPCWSKRSSRRSRREVFFFFKSWFFVLSL